ncbi:ABC transporter ATP-binding protein, partial [[Kitasatospora] papulosa]
MRTLAQNTVPDRPRKDAANETAGPAKRHAAPVIAVRDVRISDRVTGREIVHGVR